MCPTPAGVPVWGQRRLVQRTLAVLSQVSCTQGPPQTDGALTLPRGRVCAAGELAPRARCRTGSLRSSGNEAGIPPGGSGSRTRHRAENSSVRCGVPWDRSQCCF